MKTEGLADDFEKLDIFQAYEALKAGKCVRPVLHGFVHQLENGILFYWDYDGTKKATSNFYDCIGSFYRIVPDPSIPEPKSLTMEEAWDILRHPRKTVIKIKSGVPFIDSWTMTAPLNESLLLLDLAERKGWPITACECPPPF